MHKEILEEKNLSSNCGRSSDYEQLQGAVPNGVRLVLILLPIPRIRRDARYVLVFGARWTESAVVQLAYKRSSHNSTLGTIVEYCWEPLAPEPVPEVLNIDGESGTLVKEMLAFLLPPAI